MKRRITACPFHLG